MKKLIIKYTRLINYLIENKNEDGYIYFYESKETKEGTKVTFSIVDEGDSFYSMKFCPSDHPCYYTCKNGNERILPFTTEDAEAYLENIEERFENAYGEYGEDGKFKKGTVKIIWK